MNVTINDAKKIMKHELMTRGLAYTKLTGKTVDFSDLSRAREIFVCIHGWRPDPAWKELKEIAHNNGFFIETR